MSSGATARNREARRPLVGHRVLVLAGNEDLVGRVGTVTDRWTGPKDVPWLVLEVDGLGERGFSVQETNVRLIR